MVLYETRAVSPKFCVDSIDMSRSHVFKNKQTNKHGSVLFLVFYIQPTLQIAELCFRLDLLIILNALFVVLIKVVAGWCHGGRLPIKYTRS